MQKMLLVINLVAAFNGVLVGLILLFQERFNPTRTRLTLGLFLLSISLSLALFVLLDTLTIPYSQSLGVLIDALALTAAALFFDYVYTSVTPRGPSFWPYLPPVIFLGITLINGGRFLHPSDIAPIVYTTMLYSLVAFVFWLRARKSLPPGWKNRPELKRLPVLLIGIAILHLAQLLRLYVPDSQLLFDLVPLIGALAILALVVYGLVGSQTLQVMAKTRTPLSGNEVLGRQLDEIMIREKAFLDPDLSLQKTASLLNVSTTQLSTYLNHDRGVTFRSYVNALRIEEARMLLQSPEEARTSVEAISMMCGFRSRSSFYTAFQSQVGKSPQEYRTET